MYTSIKSKNTTSIKLDAHDIVFSGNEPSSEMLTSQSKKKTKNKNGMSQRVKT